MIVIFLSIFICLLSLGLARLFPVGRYRFVLPSALLVSCAGLSHIFFEKLSSIESYFSIGELVKFQLNFSPDNIDLVLLTSIAAFCASLCVFDGRVTKYCWVVILPFLFGSGAIYSNNLFTFILFLELSQLVFNYNCLTFGEMNESDRALFIYYQSFSLFLSTFFMVGSIISSSLPIDNELTSNVLVVAGSMVILLRLFALPILKLLSKRKLDNSMVFSFLGLLLPLYLLFISRHLEILDLLSVESLGVALGLMFLVYLSEYLKRDKEDLNILTVINAIFTLVFFVFSIDKGERNESGLIAFFLITNFAIFSLVDVVRRNSKLNIVEIVVGLFIISGLLLFPGSPTNLALRTDYLFSEMFHLISIISYLLFCLLFITRVLIKNKIVIEVDIYSGEVLSRSIVWVGFMSAYALLTIFFVW